MASIEINNLRPVGYDLFHDSESFINELSDREMWGLEGGILGALGGTLAGLGLQSLISGNSGFNVTGADSFNNLIDLGNLFGGRPKG
ncbi:hypothetical protein WA1_37530 [Scytonema hofmannii PCC 7110]|uniref:Bacteriocin n=1 Tax=Scytonema hofmannii PCC 7110 TaxID=128403 RepID=A0A139X028_9CYAN|nr:hypothetical protein [Scytonema hofmannii]KYC38059.1 hypothetical protein WA1_37530 [Scytonema hofmannii PCC 7110]